MQRVYCEIKEPYFTNIRDGKKIFEVVLAVGLISILKEGDIIIWTNKDYGKELICSTKIISASKYSSIDNAISNINGFSKFDPTASSTNDIINKWKKTSDEYLEDTYGVILFEFKKI